jgi:5-methylcytosine-specific restriction endonuclease McrA
MARKPATNVKGETRKKLPTRVRRAVFERDDFACVYCGASIFDDDGICLHLDHVEPWVLGGSDDAANLATACCWCNWRFGGRPKPPHIARAVLALIAARNAERQRAPAAA